MGWDHKRKSVQRLNWDAQLNLILKKHQCKWKPFYFKAGGGMGRGCSLQKYQGNRTQRKKNYFRLKETKDS
jgi:hypothetical protein